MTIDEKIEQAAREHSINPITQLDYTLGASFAKSEMLADMQKLAEALEFYASDVNWNSQGHFHNSRIDSTDMDKINNFSDDYYFGGKRARQALAEFNAKYKGEK